MKNVVVAVLLLLAIDAATAIRVYDAAGIRQIGEGVMTARAGATKIQIITASEQNSEQ